MPSGQVLDYDRAPIVTTPVKFAKFILEWIMVIGYIPPSSVFDRNDQLFKPNYISHDNIEPKQLWNFVFQGNDESVRRIAYKLTGKTPSRSMAIDSCKNLD